MKIIDKELEKVKFQSFGKVTIRNEQRSSKELRCLVSEKVKLESNLSDSKKDKLKTLDMRIQQETVNCQRQNFEKTAQIPGKYKQL